MRSMDSSLGIVLRRYLSYRSRRPLFHSSFILRTNHVMSPMLFYCITIFFITIIIIFVIIITIYPLLLFVQRHSRHRLSAAADGPGREGHGPGPAAAGTRRPYAGGGRPAPHAQERGGQHGLLEEHYITGQKVTNVYHYCTIIFKQRKYDFFNFFFLKLFLI